VGDQVPETRAFSPMPRAQKRKEDIVLPPLRPDEVGRSVFRIGTLHLVEALVWTAKAGEFAAADGHVVV
jgi:hypothetical protein